MPSAPPEESKTSSAELVLAAAIAQGLRRHRNAPDHYEATAAENAATKILEPPPDVIASFQLPDAPTPREAFDAPQDLPTAPTLVPLTTNKLLVEQLIKGHDRGADVAASNIGVLLVNVGAPLVAKPVAMWRFLKEAFNDPRATENGSRAWKMAVNGAILPVQSWRFLRRYRKIWNPDKQDFPLRTITRSQAEKLTGILEPLAKHVIVDWAMRYGEPSIAARLKALIARGCDRILVMPLYPQYSSLTTATTCDEVFRLLIGLPRQPAVRIMPAYYDDSHYIELLASSLRTELKKLSFEPDVILASYQDIAQEYLRNGDPYESQCAKTTQLLREYLKVDQKKLMMTYQSRFGHASCLQPATIKTVRALAKQGVKNLAVVMPGFASDGLETLQQIGLDAARVFKRHGGVNFAALPCLNDSEPGMLLITRLVTRELEGWV